VGLVSRSGIIPISHTQDTAGPMTRTVRDAALLLGAMAGIDPRDEATTAAKGHIETDYTRFLDADGLKGARLGLLKGYLGVNANVDKVLKPALEALKAKGAVIVDVELPRLGPETQEILSYEFKADLNAYLATRGGEIKDLAGLIAFNEKVRDKEMPWFGQEIFLTSQAKGPLTEEAYLKALEKARKAAGPDGIDKVVTTNKLDALIAPTGGPAGCIDLLGASGGGGGVSCSSFAAVSGYPHITVPSGFVFGMPLNLSFFGPAWTEGTLLRLAYAFEQATKARRAPTCPATLPIG
jgi:amidase